MAFLHGAKIGVLGGNGAGKSSFMKIIAGVDREFEGEAKPKDGFRVGYLEQEPHLETDLNVEENIMKGVIAKTELVKQYNDICAKMGDEGCKDDPEELAQELGALQEQIDALGCWDIGHKVEQAMEALRCPPPSIGVTTLSGGEKRRVALCQLLLSEPDILLLDEPTNHLDAESVAWIERFLQTYKGMVLAITHDRYFLDNVAGYILEIEAGRLLPFRGNYAQWLEHKGRRVVEEKKQCKSLERALERELGWIRKICKGGGNGRAKFLALEKMNEEQKVRSVQRKMESGALVIPEGPRLGNDILEVRDVQLVIDDRIIFENASFKLKKKSILGIIGPNGSGKTSLLKIIVGDSNPTQGAVELGQTVVIGYNAQTRDLLNPDKMVWEEICAGQDTVEVLPGEHMQGRAFVAQFNFTGPQQQKLVKQLSGGERNRLALAKSLAKGCNLILLDEPTNDLDIATLRALEEALVDFNGAAIVVSHDRWFLDRVATEILAFQEDGSVTYFDGNYSDWEKHKTAKLGKDWTPKRRKFKSICG